MARIAQYQDVAVGLARAAAVKVHQNVGAEFVPANVDAVRIRIARKVERYSISPGALRIFPG